MFYDDVGASAAARAYIESTAPSIAMMSGILERDLTNEVTIGAGDDNVLMKFDYLLFYAGYIAEHK